MANEPGRKRPVSAKRPTTRARRAASILEDPAPTPNYALRLTEELDEPEAPTASPRRALRPTVDDDNFSARLSAAIEAINAAQSTSTSQDAVQEKKVATPGGRWLAAVDKLPPIRLPIGPAIPWRVGLPALVALVVVMGVMSRSAAHADQPGVQLPAQQTYAVQQEAPLFAKPQPTETSAAPAPAAAPQPIGVQDPPGLGFDLFDLGVKLAAVLGLAYGSLLLLKRFGNGGGITRPGSTTQAMRVVSSLALAPNRSVHVIKVPGGRTLLVGATPNSVNLLADLGELADDATPDASSFFDVLKSKVGS